MEVLADAMPGKAAIPRSTDGVVDIQSLLRLLAEQVGAQSWSRGPTSSAAMGPTAGTAARRGAHRLAGFPRQGRFHRRGHVPRGVRDAGGVLPEGGKGARGGGARCARVPRLPDVAPTTCRRAQQENEVSLARGAGLPAGELTARARGFRHARPGRDMVRPALLLGEEDGLVARRGAP